jgi:hypothetical protein
VAIDRVFNNFKTECAPYRSLGELVSFWLWPCSRVFISVVEQD